MTDQSDEVTVTLKTNMDSSDDRKNSNSTGPDGDANVSNTSSNSQGNKSNEPPDDVCRDFLRNVCRRGASCRFRHPEGFEAEELGKKIEYVFCHDFQNRECRRANCRFVHATKQEEEVYKTTGKLPQHCIEKIIMNGGRAGDLSGPDAIPVCKDYLKGDCRRPPGRCKFRHINQDQEMDMRHHPLSNMNAPSHPGASVGPYSHPETAPVYQHPQQFPTGMNGNGFNPYSNAPVYAAPSAASSNPVFRNAANFGNSAGGGQNARSYDGYVPEPKRRAYDSSFDVKSGANDDSGYPHSISSAGPGPPTRYLEEENQALRRRIDELKQQVSALSSQNDYLLATNAALKASMNSSVSVSSSSTATQSPYPPIYSAAAAAGLPGSSVSSLAAALNSTVAAPIMSVPSSTNSYVSYPMPR